MNLRLTGEDKNLILDADNEDVELSCGKYFIKRMGPERVLKELISSDVASSMGISNLNYEFLKIDDQYFRLGRDLNELGYFESAEDLGFFNEDKEFESGCSLYEAWNFFEEKYGNAEKEMFSLLKVYIFDILFHHFDRNMGNWGVLTNNKQERKIIILDNEYILNETARTKIKLYSSYQEEEPAIYDDFKVFLNESSEEFISLFEFYFEKITPTYFEELVKKLIIENNLNDLEEEEISEIIDMFKENYYNLETILKEYKSKRVI